LANPILVDVTREPLTESFHRGAVAIADATGTIRAGLGDIEATIYPRSALKPIQALPLVESGAAEAFGLDDEEIALACASHSGEPMHTTRIAAWLKRIGCTESDLACGPHPAIYELVSAAMIARGETPTRIHNNCSGKHAGFLTVARHLSLPIAGYEMHDHPVQKMVAATLADLAGIDRDMPWGVDGCAVPNFALPLSAFARALAGMADPSRLSAPRADAARRIVRAMTAHPEFVSGTGRVCAILMRAGRGRFAVKTGAEGVYAGIVPERGLGIALKIDDGASRASQTAIAALLEKMGLIHGDDAAHALAHAPVTNTRDMVVGERRPAAALEELTLEQL
jgi:L-asparaginase II